jgi:hypothetical protein
LIGSNKIDIRDSKEDRMPEYDKVDQWLDIPESAIFRSQGWGRRADRGCMYGPSYITDEIEQLVTDCVRRGNEVSSEKVGAAQVREFLEEQFPGIYCLPGDTELSKVITNVVKREKEAKKKKPKKKTDLSTKLPDEVLERIRELMDAHPNETGMKIEQRLSQSYRGRKPAGYDRKAVMEKVGAWRAAANAKRKARQRKRHIG